jgi:hypothetical protein
MKKRHRWWNLRRTDILGILGVFLLVPQLVDFQVNGTSAEPTLAGIGLTLVLAAFGGPRIVDALEATLGQNKETSQ